MRIVSLNVNGFCGLADKRGYSFGGSGNSSEENSMEHAGKVCEAILKERVDVVFLSEFDVCSAAGQEAIRRMKDGGYSPAFPNRWSFISPGYTSIVVAFVKGACSREKSPGNWLQWNEMLLQGYRLIGLHITRDSMWEDILAAYERHREEKVVFIGDFNVSHRETYGKQKMEDLMKMGAVDAFVACHGAEADGPAGNTYVYTGWDGRKGYTRIDYALLSPAALDFLVSMENRQSAYEAGLSDHAALVLELK